jgi:hypothetical protein
MPFPGEDVLKAISKVTKSIMYPMGQALARAL